MYVKFIKLFNNAIISPMLCKILNLCLVNGEFFDDIKIAEVVPFCKRGDSLECSNYRHISFLSNLSKIFKKGIFYRTYSFLSKNNLLSSKLFDFKQNFSTNYTMSVIYDNLL